MNIDFEAMAVLEEESQNVSSYSYPLLRLFTTLLNSIYVLCYVFSNIKVIFVDCWLFYIPKFFTSVLITCVIDLLNLFVRFYCTTVCGISSFVCWMWWLLMADSTIGWMERLKNKQMLVENINKFSYQLCLLSTCGVVYYDKQYVLHTFGIIAFLTEYQGH